MTLQELLRQIGEMGKAQRLINFSVAGTSLDQINPMQIDWYPLLFLSPTGSHQIRENVKVFDITIYYIDRLLEDYSNDIDIFSSAIENLENLLNGVKTIDGVVDVEDTYTVRNFANTEKMNDSLAGAYAQVRITVAKDNCFIEGEEPDSEESR